MSICASQTTWITFASLSFLCFKMLSALKHALFNFSIWVVPTSILPLSPKLLFSLFDFRLGLLFFFFFSVFRDIAGLGIASTTETILNADEQTRCIWYFEVPVHRKVWWQSLEDGATFTLMLQNFPLLWETFWLGTICRTLISMTWEYFIPFFSEHETGKVQWPLHEFQGSVHCHVFFFKWID